MLEWLNSKLHLISVLWLFPIIFMFHDFEEILTIESWIKQHRERVLEAIPRSIRKYFESTFQMTTLQFAQDVFWIFLTITAATSIAVLFSNYYLFLAILFLFLAHVFTHIGQALFFRMYTPGVITAIFLVLPYSLYAYYRLFIEHAIRHSDLWWSSIGAILLLPFLFLYLVHERNKRTINRNKSEK